MTECIDQFKGTNHPSENDPGVAPSYSPGKNAVGGLKRSTSLKVFFLQLTVEMRTAHANNTVVDNENHHSLLPLYLRFPYACFCLQSN